MATRRDHCKQCGKGPDQGVTLYDVGNGPHCARHFTGKAAASKPRKGRAP